MAKGRARVVLNGRFSPGTRLRLVEVRDERQLRPGAGDREVDVQFVDEDGHVEFTSGVTDGARYFICGYQNGFPLEIRARGRVAGDEDEVNSVAPVGTEPRKFANAGGDVDVAPADAVAAAEEQERLRKAGPAGSPSEAEERAAIRSEKREEREAAADDEELSDEEEQGKRAARAQSTQAPLASNDTRRSTKEA